MNFKQMNDKNLAKRQLKYQTKCQDIKTSSKQLQFTLNSTHRKSSETMVLSSSTRGKLQENQKDILYNIKQHKINDELEGLRTIYNRKNTVKSLIPQSQQQPEITFIQSQLKAKMQRKNLLYSMNLRLDQAATQRQMKKNTKNNSQQLFTKQNQVFKQISHLQQLVAEIKMQAQKFFGKQKKLQKYQQQQQQQLFKTSIKKHNPSQKTHKRRTMSLLQQYPTTHNKLKQNFNKSNKGQQLVAKNKLLRNNQQISIDKNISQSPLGLLNNQLVKSIISMDYQSKYSQRKYK